MQQTTSADNIFRCIFFLGALRVKLPLVIKIFVLSIFSGCFTQVLLYLSILSCDLSNTM